MKEDLDACVEALWTAATAGDEYAAVDTVITAVEAGVPLEDLLLDVVAPIQARVGQEWAANRIGVAQEHAVTAVNDRVVAVLAHHPAARTRRASRPGRVTVACVDGEWHGFPARLLAEVLRLRGWQAEYLGAQVPTPHLVAHLHRTSPDAVALSSSLATRLPIAHAAITACQATGTPVLAGGAAFGPDGRYARLLGADAWASDARRADDVLIEVLASGRTPHPEDRLSHLADQEYTLVSRNAPELVRGVMGQLWQHVPEMVAYTEHQLQRTAEDVAYIVDFLRAALYVADPDLFTDFLAWTAGILTARSVPARALLPTLDLLAGRLRDFPHALDALARGRAILSAQYDLA